MAVTLSDGAMRPEFLVQDQDVADRVLMDTPDIVEAAGRFRFPRWTRGYVAVLALADLVAAMVAALFCWIVRPAANSTSVQVLSWRFSYWALAVMMTPIWLAVMAREGAYRRGHAGERLRDFRLPVVTAVRLAGAASIAAFGLHIGLSRLLVIVYFPTLLVSAVLLRAAARWGLAILRRRGRALRRMLLVGDPACVAKFAGYLMRSPAHDYRLIGACVPGELSFVAIRGGRLLVVGRPDGLVDAAQRVKADTVAIVGDPHLEDTTIQEVSWRMERSGRDLLIAPDVVDLAGPRIEVGDLGGLPLLRIGDPLIGERRQVIKSGYERVLAIGGLILLAPVFAMVALAILMDSGGPVLYRQERVGFKGRLFTMVKFRTMRPAADKELDQLKDKNEHDGALFKIKDDPRVTRVGKWLRRYSIDELPQLFNVIQGDMVLVGPRPVLPRETVKFNEAAHRRFMAKPGMTGLWQVSGRSDIPWEEGVRLDLYYVENWSPWMDLMIVWRTLGVMLTGSGGY